ncbi:hypothetical protein M0R45_019942 [Rubus argutus]|uniref:Protein kinase domain-containing protein n=1 Tax=Rubus argutus TaxID=59490 RepID=A0AAW1XA91_RUBAR
MSCLLKRQASCECGEWVRGDLICKGAWASVFKAYPVTLVEGFPAIMAVKVAEVSEPKKLTPLINEGQMLSEFQDCPLLSSLQFIHEKGYVHGDIKQDNILLVPQVTSGSSHSER